MDELVGDALVTRLVELRQYLARPVPARVVAARVDYSAKLAAVKSKRARFLEAFADGDMTQVEMRAALAKLDVERTKLESLAAKAEPSAVTADERDAVREKLGAIETAWGRMLIDGRRKVLRILTSAVAIAYRMTPEITWRSVDEITAGKLSFK